MAIFGSTSSKYKNFLDELNRIVAPSSSKKNTNGAAGGGASSWGVPEPTYDLGSYGTADFSNDSTLKSLKNLYNNVGSGYSVKAIDLTPIIDTKKASAQSQKDALTTYYQNNRQTLLDSIKRFQRQTEENRANQREEYLSQRGDLENAAFMADRQNRISAASRGLAGSGLQQLSQLGNILAQSAEINKAARANQKAQDALTTALNDAQADSDRNLLNLENTYTNDITSIDRTLEEAISELIYNEQVRQEQARQQAASQAASQRASLAAQIAAQENALRADYDDGIRVLRNIQNSLDDQLRELSNNGTKTSKKVKQDAKDLVTYYTNLLDHSAGEDDGKGYIAQYRLGQQNRDTAVNNYDTLLRKYNLK